MSNNKDLVKDLNDSFINMASTIEQIAEVAELYPVKIGEKYGLVEGGELSDEDEAKAIKEWKDIIRHISFLMKESNEETCTSDLVKKANDLIDEKIEVHNKLQTIANKESKDYIDLFNKYEDLVYQYDDASQELYNYQNQCKNEAFDLLKTWWWDLMWW